MHLDNSTVNSPDPSRPTNGRICILTSNFPRWEGDSTTPFILNLAQDMAALGLHPEVLAPHALGAEKQEILGGVQVYRFRYFFPESAQTVCYQGGALINLRKNRLNWAKLPALVFFELISLFRLIRRQRFDVIHAHWILPQGFVAVLVGMLLKVPVVVTVHGGDAFALRGKILQKFKRFVLTRAAAVTVNSSATEAAIRAITDRITNLKRIPMGATALPALDPAQAAYIRALYLKDGGPLLIFIGRLVEEKGLDDLLGALAQLQDDLPGASLMVLGEGQERDRFEALAMSLGLRKHVHFLGWVESSQVHLYLAAADILVAPSRMEEGQGLILVEAQLADTPVIATRNGGFLDIVEHGKTGLIVERGSEREIAEAISRLALNPDFVARLILNGRQSAEQKFTREVSAHRFAITLRKAFVKA